MFDRAMFAYIANEVDELNLNKGDYVVVHHASDDGWYTGLNVSTGKLGTSVHEYLTYRIAKLTIRIICVCCCC